MIASKNPLGVVTGASSGIGYELARQFVENGFDLIIAADSEKINDAASKLAAMGGNIIPVRADLSTRIGVDQLYQTIINNGLPVDAIAINAGIGTGGRFAELDMEDDQKVIDLNVTSTMRLAKMIVPDMVKNGKGKILFTASVVSVNPAPYQAVYGATKAFVLYLAESLREELKDTGVTVTALMPGATDTNFFKRAKLEDTAVGKAKKDDPAKVAEDGFKAMMAGKDKVIAHSMMSKVNGLMGELMPDTINAKLMGHMSEPGSARK